MVRRVLDWHDELEDWLEPFLTRLGHKAQRRMCPLYIAGLIGPGDRKSVQPMAERLVPTPSSLTSCGGRFSDVRTVADGPARGRPVTISAEVVAIPCSGDNPKTCRIDDAEVVGDLVAVAVPVPRHVVPQKGQDRSFEVLEAGVAPIVRDVAMHQPP